MRKLWTDGITKKPIITILIAIGVILVLIGVSLFLLGGYLYDTRTDTNHNPTPHPSATATNTPEKQEALDLLTLTGHGLIDSHINDRQGWTWRSAMQSPHLQTDRDVGVAGTIMGFLTMWQTTGNPAYLDAAKQGGDWLLAVAYTDGGTKSWPDHADNTQNRSDDFFTSFDDGTAGISDILWQLGKATNDQKYIDAAIAGMNWEMAQGQGIGSQACPSQECRWQWSNNDLSYQTGMGEGTAGVVYAFDIFAERTGNTRYSQYAKAGAQYIETLITPNGAIPEASQDTHYNTGFVSGASGVAFMYLHLYEHTHNTQYLHDANHLLQWVYSQKVISRNGISWPIMIDPIGGNDRDQATGFEEGNAGIGWVALQAFHLTKDETHLEIAKQAGNWLLGVAQQTDSTGVSWKEDDIPGANPTHTGLDNGAAGIGWFLHDLYIATGDTRYEQGAKGAMDWLNAVAQKSGSAALWYENRDNSQWNIYQDPSWHWGGAGIAGFFARMAGGTIDMPGEESAL